MTHRQLFAIRSFLYPRKVEKFSFYTYLFDGLIHLYFELFIILAYLHFLFTNQGDQLFHYII